LLKIAVNRDHNIDPWLNSAPICVFFYFADFKSKEMRVRQRAVALYFIDKLALRAGNEKDEDQADTVGCCSLRVEHITLHEEHEGGFLVALSSG
jgi:DNA topoisomerase IB